MQQRAALRPVAQPVIAAPTQTGSEQISPYRRMERTKHLFSPVRYRRGAHASSLCLVAAVFLAVSSDVSG